MKKIQAFLYQWFVVLPALIAKIVLTVVGLFAVGTIWLSFLSLPVLIFVYLVKHI
jgi:hypothetical protein